MQKDVYTLADLREWRDEQPPIRLAVLGDPVAHSKSPQMHNAALRACGIEAAYARLHLGPEDFADALQLIAENGFIGVNVTIPHKAAALALADDVDTQARRARGVNTIVVKEDGRLAGFSTDGPGFARAVREEFGAGLKELRVLVLGAGGGAGRAISLQCADAVCQRLVLANRTFHRAASLAGELWPEFHRVEAIPLEEAALAQCLPEIDLIVNATPLGMAQFGDVSPVSPSLLRPAHLVYDTVYTTGPTPLLNAARVAGARGANGLSMLLHQGALSFEKWFHRPAPLEVMREALGKAD